MAFALSWPGSALLSPPLQRQGPELDGAFLAPGWAVGWGTGSLEGAVHRILVYGIKVEKTREK